MIKRSTDRSARRVGYLVWLVAAIGVAGGAVVLTDISMRLRIVRENREQTDQARNVVFRTLYDLRAYRQSLMEELDQLHVMMFGRSLEKSQDLPEDPADFDQARVARAARSLEASIATLGGNNTAAEAALLNLTNGLEQAHRSLQKVWRGAASARESVQRCATLRAKVNADLEQLSGIVDRRVGLNRLQVARQLADIRNRDQVDRIDQLEQLVDDFRAVQQPSQLHDDLRDLALDSERFFALEDGDSLRNQKDNSIRQTLSRLRRDSVRLGADREQFLQELDSYQHHLFGQGSQDDSQHQMLLTSVDGYYQQKLQLIENFQILRMESRKAEQAARKCQAAERQLNAAVVQMHTDAVRNDSELMKDVSRALYAIAGVASALFLAASWWIAGLVSRAMQQSQERQRESQEVAKIIRESPIEVYILNQQTLRFVEVNRGACRNLGYSREEILEMTPVDITSYKDVETLLGNLRPLGDGAVDQLEFHTDHFRKDKSAYPVQAVLHRAVYHELAVYVAFVTDLTQVKLLEQQLSQAQKLESIGQLAAGLAHEINTPMQFIADNVEFLATAFRRLQGVISTYDGLLTTDEELAWKLRRDTMDQTAKLADLKYHSEEMIAAIAESQEGIQRVVEIARAMKEFSHPGGKEKVWASVNDMVQSTATISRNRWKYTAELDLDLDPNLPAVPLLVSEFNQVLLNLVVNASDAIAERQEHEPGLVGAITIRTRSADDGVVVEVEDNGGGIPDAIGDKVYDPFFTTKEVGKGTGQGLSISRNVIVKQHAGRMDFVSTPGEGTRFVLWLPANSPVDELGLEAVEHASSETDYAPV